MAGKQISMHQFKQIIELLNKNYSVRSIVELSGISRNTVRTYKLLIEQSKIPFEQLLLLDDEALSAIVHAKNEVKQTASERWKDFQSRLDYFSLELCRRGVTRQLLWYEYREEYPGGYSYSQFCDHLLKELNVKKAVMHFTHHPAEQMMVDFAGGTMSYVDRTTGEIHLCQVLVCTLPFSNYTYVEALRSQKQEDFISGCSNALYFIGGAPQSIKCDNLKPAVIRANRYEPVFTEAMEFFATFYGITAMAARAGKPRDKPNVEGAVNVVYNRIYGPLRNEVFYSLKELNHAIRIQLEKYNDWNFQGKNYSRKNLFEKEEKNLLKNLPDQPYNIRHTVQAKVQKNYHVILGEDSHQYSVPYTLIGKTLKLIYTNDQVEIYDDYKRVVLHSRNYKKGGYSTLKGHMPTNHAYMHERKGWNVDAFMNQGEAIGPATRTFIARILSSKNFLEQSFNSCLGIFRLGTHYGNDRLEAACLRAKDAPYANYGIINNILKNGLDKTKESAQPTIPTHENIRGKINYE